MPVSLLTLSPGGSGANSSWQVPWAGTPAASRSGRHGEAVAMRSVPKRSTPQRARLQHVTASREIARRVIGTRNGADDDAHSPYSCASRRGCGHLAHRGDTLVVTGGIADWKSARRDLSRNSILGSMGGAAMVGWAALAARAAHPRHHRDAKWIMGLGSLATKPQRAANLSSSCSRQRAYGETGMSSTPAV